MLGASTAVSMKTRTTKDAHFGTDRGVEPNNTQLLPAAEVLPAETGVLPCVAREDFAEQDCITSRIV